MGTHSKEDPHPQYSSRLVDAEPFNGALAYSGQQDNEARVIGNPRRALSLALTPQFPGDHSADGNPWFGLSR